MALRVCPVTSALVLPKRARRGGRQKTAPPHSSRTVQPPLSWETPVPTRVQEGSGGRAGGRQRCATAAVSVRAMTPRRRPPFHPVRAQGEWRRPHVGSFPAPAPRLPPSPPTPTPPPLPPSTAGWVLAVSVERAVSYPAWRVAGTGPNRRGGCGVRRRPSGRTPTQRGGRAPLLWWRPAPRPSPQAHHPIDGRRSPPN